MVSSAFATYQQAQGAMISRVLPSVKKPDFHIDTDVLINEASAEIEPRPMPEATALDAHAIKKAGNSYHYCIFQ